MTNREKYINKMSNEDIADRIRDNVIEYCDFCSYTYNIEDCKKRDCKKGILQWLEGEVEMTADEMFKELGYEKTSDRLEGVEYQKIENGTQIILIIKGKNGKCGYARYSNNLIETDCGKWGQSNYEFITEEENKAIQKKIEELKENK